MSDNWRDRAACKGSDPELFHPMQGEVKAARQAKEVCDRCDVRQECLDYAVENNEQHGIWGGTSVRQRERLRKAMHLPVEYRTRMVRVTIRSESALKKNQVAARRAAEGWCPRCARYIHCHGRLPCACPKCSTVDREEAS